jgi:hypothetical protein
MLKAVDLHLMIGVVMVDLVAGLGGQVIKVRILFQLWMDILTKLLCQLHKEILAVQQVLEMLVHPAIAGVVLITVVVAEVLEVLVVYLYHLQQKAVKAVQEKITVLFLDHL